MMRARGERKTRAGPGRRNAVRQVASPGSSDASRRSISASARCSSADSAIQLPPRRAPGEYPLTISQEPVFIQSFLLRTSPVFVAPAVRRSGPPARDELHTSGDTKVGNLAMIEQSFYPVGYALGQSAAR